MARMNIYLPDDLAAEAKEANLNVSALAQEAIREELQRRAFSRWLASIPRHERGPSREAVLQALDEAREELGR